MSGRHAVTSPEGVGKPETPRPVTAQFRAARTDTQRTTRKRTYWPLGD